MSLFIARPEIDKLTFNNIRTLIGSIFSDFSKIALNCISPVNDVRRHTDIIHALNPPESVAELDDIIHALRNENVIAETAVFTRGACFDEFYSEYPCIDSITWLVQEFLRIEERGEQLQSGETLLDSAIIVDHANVASQTQNGQAMAPLMNVSDLLVKG